MAVGLNTEKEHMKCGVYGDGLVPLVELNDLWT